MNNFIKTIVLLTALSFTFISCGTPSSPIDRLKSSLKDVPTYSILLEDMKEDGFISPSYYHKYRVVTPDDAYVTPWLKVSEKYFRLNSGFLGMSLVDKKDGKIEANPSPPGYQYVGDPQYGQWRTDSSGNSFWEFYGKYALFSHLMGGWYRPVYRNDYDNYRSYSGRNMVYYGKNNTYGTSGSLSRQNNPSFFERRKAREAGFKQKFQSNLNKKVGRTKTGTFRGKAGRVGK
ncbi:MAG: hypothetical protein RBR08_13455 [Desulforegulaceae bacterium]|nr:hypothetical protein [Desulforegulaceae bacterium]